MSGEHDGVPAVLFDLDGTLLDPAGAITETIAEAIQAQGYPRPDEATLRRFVGPPASVGLERHTDLDERQRRAALAAYREAYPARAARDSRLYPGVAQLLRDLRAAGAAVALATQKPQPSAERIAAHFGLDALADVISGARDELRPETAHLPADKAGVIARALDLLARRGLAADPRRTVMVGDREYDVEGARVHGLDCVGVAWGFAAPGELTAHGAAAVVEDADALRAQLARRCDLRLEGDGMTSPP
ncbi:MAG: HAD hydrolase-like protein [Actinomycetia bacterium]|nr:HAD hydrolase-like protein [Actinomycetes bacterium]